ncbi:unnamed protein product [Trichogramma brassicae]|uniref:RNA-directed DNA polymerase n=1 Tax=Trichogramma brassicae TaxID=86971 RepID=A0A6H5IFJ4_9HYME|nr:unnamed protein product [Trichogramma brassicae]
MEYDFEIVYRKGSVHYVPDALSRAFDKEVCAFEKIEDEWYLKKRLDVQREPSKFKDWTIEDGMLYKRGRSALLDPVTNAENGWRLVVPAERRQRVLFDAHSLTSSGHLGAKKTYDRAACEYWWPGMWYDVEKFCSACEVCASDTKVATDRADRAYDEEGRRSTLGCSSGGYDGVSAKQKSK